MSTASGGSLHSGVVAPRGVWWVPAGRQERLWIAIAFCWCLVLFAMMPFWHLKGGQNPSGIRSRVEPMAFMARTMRFVEDYRIGEENGIPLVAPPPGSDVYLLAQMWSWYPALQLEQEVAALHRDAGAHQMGRPRLAQRFEARLPLAARLADAVGHALLDQREVAALEPAPQPRDPALARRLVDLAARHAQRHHGDLDRFALRRRAPGWRGPHDRDGRHRQQPPEKHAKRDPHPSTLASTPSAQGLPGRARTARKRAARHSPLVAPPHGRPHSKCPPGCPRRPET